MKEHYEGSTSVRIVCYNLGSRIDIHKSCLISCTKRKLDDLGWTRMVVQREMICQHIGYPIGWDVPNVKILDWISTRIVDKIIYRKSQAWLGPC